MLDSHGPPDRDDARFAENLKRIRESQGMTKADLVRTLREAGWDSVHQTTVTRIENGERPVRLGESRVIARALKTSLERLVREPSEARVEDRIEEDIRSLKEAFNGIVDGTESLLQFSEQLGREVNMAKSGKWVFGDGIRADVRHTARLADLIKEAERYADVTIEEAVESGRRYHEELMHTNHLVDEYGDELGNDEMHIR